MAPDLYAVDAQFYDAIHAGLDADTGLWLSFAGRTTRPVLEAGCGTGRIAVQLARAGHTVTGLDRSAAMLEGARRKAQGAGVSLELIEGSLPEVPLAPAYFGFVLVPADVFLYCQDLDQQRAWLNALSACLAFDGLLALDLPGPAAWLDPSTNGQPQLIFRGLTEKGLKFEAWQVHQDDLASQTRWLQLRYELAGDDGALRVIKSDHELRYLYRFELELLLAGSGLDLEGLYGDYDLGPLTTDSERMIAIARRAVP